MRLSRDDEYADYAEVYDAYKGDRSRLVSLVNRLIAENTPFARDILDLACGTGAVTQAFTSEFNVTALDRSDAMLSIARQRLPKSSVIKGDMSNFRLKDRFDVILCLHNSMNHLLSAKQWRNTFKTVHTHLRKDGIFIFDLNTPQRMDWLASQPEVIEHIGNTEIMTRVSITNNNHLYNWDMFMIKADKTITHKPIKVMARPINKIISDSRQLRIVDMFVLNDNSRDDKGRVFLVFKRP